MKQTKFLFSLILILFSPLALAQAQPLDKVVAVVDQGVVLQSELQERLEQVRQRAASNSMGLPDEEVLKEQVLEHLINERLQLQMAERAGLNVTDEHVNRAIESIRQNNNLSPEAFSRQLQTDGITMAQLRDQVRQDITIQQIQQGMVQQRIQISPLEIENFLNSADAQFWVSPEYQLGHILVSLPQSPNAEDAEKARAQAQAIVERIRGGADFAELAIAESDGPAALEGGDIGWRKTSDLPSLFADIVPNLEVGSVSEPARSGAGFHILKLYDKRGETQQVQTQSKVRHILIKPSAIVSNEEAQRKLQNIREEIQQGAQFAELAKEHSEDIGSMLSGGELGWSSPGMFVPEFENVVQNTAVGEVSEPFRSQFGWHILQVSERREQDITDDVLREKAIRLLTHRRFEDELQIWVRELRDAAYVDIKI